VSRLAKSNAFAGHILFDELDAAGLECRANFPYGSPRSPSVDSSLAIVGSRCNAVRHGLTAEMVIGAL